VAAIEIVESLEDILWVNLVWEHLPDLVAVECIADDLVVSTPAVACDGNLVRVVVARLGKAFYITRNESVNLCLLLLAEEIVDAEKVVEVESWHECTA